MCCSSEQRLAVKADPKIKGPQVVLNIFELLHEFKTIGEGIVHKVQPKTS